MERKFPVIRSADTGIPAASCRHLTIRMKRVVEILRGRTLAKRGKTVPGETRTFSDSRPLANSSVNTRTSGLFRSGRDANPLLDEKREISPAANFDRSSPKEQPLRFAQEM